jgi:hypothetical protein
MILSPVKKHDEVNNGREMSYYSSDIIPPFASNQWNHP